jgi:hypothetical protein
MISDNADDARLGGKISVMNRLVYVEVTDVNRVRLHLEKYPETIVFWDMENAGANVGLTEFFPGRVDPKRIFAITERELSFYPHLHSTGVFGHHLQRRFLEPATEVYSRLVAICQEPPGGLRTVFTDDVKVNSIAIRNSNYKRAAIEAIQKILATRGAPSRLAATVAQAVDELLLNAVFDAAVSTPKGKERHEGSRGIEFELSASEEVTMEFGASSTYMAVCVSDLFGALRKEDVSRALLPYFQKQPQASETALPQGLGLHGILKSGLSLALNIKPGSRTDAILFVPFVPSYKEFRSSFRFFSLLSHV